MQENKQTNNNKLKNKNSYCKSNIQNHIKKTQQMHAIANIIIQMVSNNNTNHNNVNIDNYNNTKKALKTNQRQFY